MYSTFLSILLVTRNSVDLPRLLARVGETAAPLVKDYEIVVVDNGSDAGSLDALALTGVDGLPNLQIFMLPHEIGHDEAVCIGLERSLGDHVLVFDPDVDDIGQLPRLLDAAVGGAAVVFGRNRTKPRHGLAYSLMRGLFTGMYRMLAGINLDRDMPGYRLLSKQAVHLILGQPLPHLAYRHFPASGGLSRRTLDYDSPPAGRQIRSLREGFDRGMRMLLSSGHGPIRLVTALTLFGAAANLVYAAYVLLVAAVKPDVLPGWVSLSLQQSGMFFLISVVLLVLGEYVAHLARLGTEGPSGYVSAEHTSVRIDRLERLNVVSADEGSR